MLTTLAVITATVFGVMVGVEFAVAVFVGPMLRRLPVGSWIEGNAYGARILGRVMPFWYIGSLLLTAWLAAATWGGPAGDAAVAAAGLLVHRISTAAARLFTAWSPGCGRSSDP